MPYNLIPQKPTISVGQKWGKKMAVAGKKLTIKELQALTELDHGRSIREDGGLCGKVRAGKLGITVLFRYEYKLGGTKKDHRLGSWPKKSLAEIRAERDKVRATVIGGIDPGLAKKAAKIQRRNEVQKLLANEEAELQAKLTLNDLFNLWIDEGVFRSDGNKELRRAYSMNIAPSLGHIELRRLTESQIRSALKPVISAGRIRKAQVMLLNIKQMLTWAEKRKPWRGLLADGNPAALITEDSITPPTHQDQRERTLSPFELRELQDIFTSMSLTHESAAPGTKHLQRKPFQLASQLAIWISLATICRIGELLMAKWEHVDLQQNTWFIPKDNVKGRRGKKQDHLVYLSPFAANKFTALKLLTGTSAWCFPARNALATTGHVFVNSVAKQIGDRQVRFMQRAPIKNRCHDNSLVLSNGANGNWTPHDMRRTGATMMQSLGVPLEVIDRCQNHVLNGSKVRRHYLHYDYAKEKMHAWQALGLELERILFS
ncbi:tyrosine-type recombinase/integrase [Lampropedia aestuarii]|uniref:tyrosine-type recombinase/integrase n=1 Tax=Lampropedia aestuarii TaxID=2562762 RepID=UPI0024689572|nr:site-specific integrase [Lampropedia aestuarii]MDH5856463.1 tyrosine-type recombinase/integrase [Lampropedia aestuarii]